MCPSEHLFPWMAHIKNELSSTKTAILVDGTFKLTLTSIRTPVSMDGAHQNELPSTRIAFSMDRAGHDCYPPPTKPRVAMLMRTEGGKTDLKATKQAYRVLPVVKTSSTSRMCLNMGEPSADRRL